MYIYICLYTHIYIYIDIYVHTHTHMCIYIYSNMINCVVTIRLHVRLYACNICGELEGDWVFVGSIVDRIDECNQPDVDNRYDDNEIQCDYIM